MGLDMYLSAKFFFSDYDFREKDHPSRVTVRKIADAVGVAPTPDHPCVYVDVTVAYWRKANAIHGWFVENVQDGVDECQESYVSREQLQELVDACTATINAAVVKCPSSPPPDDRGKWLEWLGNFESWDGIEVSFLEGFDSHLTPRSGFFFGGTEYDAWYLWNLLRTQRMLTEILNDSRYKDADFVYRASW